jgi:hypothetical protein
MLTKVNKYVSVRVMSTWTDASVSVVITILTLQRGVTSAARMMNISPVVE